MSDDSHSFPDIHVSPPKGSFVNIDLNKGSEDQNDDESANATLRMMVKHTVDDEAIIAAAMAADAST